VETFSQSEVDCVTGRRELAGFDGTGDQFVW